MSMSKKHYYPKGRRYLQHTIKGIINMVEVITIRSKKQTPGPRPNPCPSFSICHWNLNSLTAHNYLEVSLLRAYVAIRKFDVVCLLETYLDSSNLSDDDNFNLLGYNVVRADHPSNSVVARMYQL